MSVPIALTRLVGHMQRWHRQGYEPYHLFLSQDAVKQASREGYLALARLVKARYFSVIVTTNSNGLLEQGLESVGLELTVLSIGKDADEPIFQALEGFIDEACIIKLPQGYEDKAPTTPLLSSALHIAIQRYLSCDLIVVGPVTPDSKLIEVLQPVGPNSTYYCIHEQPSPHDIIVQLLQLKGSSEEDFLIGSEHGHFDMFFQEIVSRLHLKETLPELNQDVPPSVKQRQDGRHTSRKVPVAESHNTISQGVPIHLPHVQKADILLVTVTEIEEQALLDYFPSPDKHLMDEQAYYDFGRIGPARTVMVRSNDMGPFAVIHCIDEGIEHFSPHAVIMVGIAFGLHPHKQDIGDILVAQQIMNCDFQKIRTGPDDQPVSQRGSGIPVTERLLSYFHAGQQNWTPPPHIHFGQILSSSRLIDHKGTRDELLRSFPEAIGGEMEGHGLCDVCSHKKVDWILVKAICDWADGNKGENKDSYQRQAADNAARFVLSVIRQYGFKSWQE